MTMTNSHGVGSQREVDERKTKSWRISTMVWLVLLTFGVAYFDEILVSEGL